MECMEHDKKLKNWNDATIKKPDTEIKYRVLIDCDGEIKESECTYFVDKKRFHFDMPHINWKVIRWI